MPENEIEGGVLGWTKSTTNGSDKISASVKYNIDLWPRIYTPHILAVHGGSFPVGSPYTKMKN